MAQVRPKKHKRGKKFNFNKIPRPKPITATEAEIRRRMILEHMEKHGVIKCPPGYSHMDL